MNAENRRDEISSVWKVRLDPKFTISEFSCYCFALYYLTVRDAAAIFFLIIRGMTFRSLNGRITCAKL